MPLSHLSEVQNLSLSETFFGCTTKAMTQSPIQISPIRSSSSSENLPPEGDRTVLGAVSSRQNICSMLTRDSFNEVSSWASPKRSHSLPAMRIADKGSSSLGSYVIDLSNLDNEVWRPISRSFSFPRNVKSRYLLSDSPTLVHVISATACSGQFYGNIQKDAIEESHAIAATQTEGHDTYQEEAACRICLIELGEGETLKMECSCKGELALAHKKCAVEWFSIKGNKTCDICKRDVQNLPVTLLKKGVVRSADGLSPHAFLQGQTINPRIWQDLPVLVLVSMLVYFCLLEQLLETDSLKQLNDMGKQTLTIALPFSCVLGLLSAMVASIVVSRSNIWAFASLQFFFVILCAYIMYNLLRVSPMLSVLFSSFIGYGIAICVNSFFKWYFTSRQSALSDGQQNNQHEMHPQPQGSPETQNRDGVGQLE